MCGLQPHDARLVLCLELCIAFSCCVVELALRRRCTAGQKTPGCRPHDEISSAQSQPRRTNPTSTAVCLRTLTMGCGDPMAWGHPMGCNAATPSARVPSVVCGDLGAAATLLALTMYGLRRPHEAHGLRQGAHGLRRSPTSDGEPIGCVESMFGADAICCDHAMGYGDPTGGGKQRLLVDPFAWHVVAPGRAAGIPSVGPPDVGGELRDGDEQDLPPIGRLAEPPPRAASAPRDLRTPHEDGEDDASLAAPSLRITSKCTRRTGHATAQHPQSLLDIAPDMG